MGYSKSDKAETHARIVSVAAKRFRELGLEGIGVADVMKEAGLRSVVSTNISIHAMNWWLRL
jgi:AcrR family transcriptional regulator